MDGIIILNKPKGFTSHDCVNKMRGILKTKKVGHTGTLDPNVTGVLPICVGKATKLSEFMIEKDKEYICEIVLGYDTDTEDMDGTILKAETVTEIDTSVIDDALNSFLGETDQMVPMYSSVKINGKKLYSYAREGNYIEDRPIRKIFTKEIARLSEPRFENGKCYFEFKALVSKGTYIRTLCKDLGKKLGIAAAMNKLSRTLSGNFTLEDANTFEEIESGKYTLHPIDKGLNINKLVIEDENTLKMIKNGMTISKELVPIEEQTALYDKDCKLLAIYDIFDNIRYVKPTKVIGG